MRNIALALLLAALLVMQISLRAAGIDSLLLAPVSVVIGMAAAVVAQGGVNWLAVGLGATSSLAFGWLEGWSPVVAVGIMCALWLAPRVWLARSRTDWIVAACSSLGAAALAAVVLVRYASEPLVLHVASCVFAGAALSMSTLAGRADSPALHALRVSCRAARGPARELLEKSVTLIAQRDEASAASVQRPIPRGQIRLLARLADQLVAQQGFQGQEAQQQRADLEAHLGKAVEALESTSPASPPKGKPADPPAAPAAEPTRTEPGQEPQPAVTQPEPAPQIAHN